MKIIELRADNFKILRAVEIRPDGKPVVMITGQNGAGKTSVLESVAAALGGEKLCPAVPIRQGEDHAEVTVDLGEFIVTRRWTASGSTLSVKTPDGAKYPSPQKILDGIIGKLSFDPLAFTRASPAEQVETLRKIVGLDFTAIEARKRETYEQRTLVNREVTTLKGSLSRMPEVEAPDELVSIAALLAEQDVCIAQQRKLDLAQREADKATRRREDARTRLAEARETVAEFERRLAQARNAVATAEEALAVAERAEDAAGGICSAITVPDVSAVRAKIAEAESINNRVRAKKARAAEAERLAQKERLSDALSVQIIQIEAKKQAELAAGRFPVPGLSFGEHGVTLDGLPLEQASSAAQLRVSLAIGMALNPRLRVLLIRDGSLLDEKSLALVGEMAEAAGAQVWMEVVSKDGAGGILIEDGAVVQPGLRLVRP